MGRKTNLITLLDLCVSSQYCLPTLSHDSIGYGGRCEYGCERMFISTKDPLQGGRTQSSHQACQNREKSRPSIDCDVTRSSTDLAVSTSLNHNIAIVGHLELEHTSVLKLVFQQWKSEESGNLSKCKFEI